MTGALLDRNVVAPNYLIETKMRFRPDSVADAGIQIGNGPDSVYLSRAVCFPELCSGDALYLTSVIDDEFDDGWFAPIPADTGDVYLSIRHINGLYVGAFSLDGVAWEEVGRVSQNIDNSTYGLFVWSGAPTALFDWFEEQAL